MYPHKFASFRLCGGKFVYKFEFLNRQVRHVFYLCLRLISVYYPLRVIDIGDGMEPKVKCLVTFMQLPLIRIFCLQLLKHNAID